MGWVQRQSAWRGKGSTRAQRKERALVLQRDNYLCQPCAKRGIYTAATEVDHIVNMASGGKDILSNKQAICRDCHRIKTLKESRGGGVGKSGG